jgi:AraC-like DNA-binding protein
MPSSVPASVVRAAREYRVATGLAVAFVREGAMQRAWGRGYPWPSAGSCGVDLALMTREAARWGEPAITLDRNGCYLWCVPVTDNNQVLGGLFGAEATPPQGRNGQASGAELERARAVTGLAWTLMEKAIGANACNEALMRWNRSEGLSHARRAEAIHTAKGLPSPDPREIYLREEHELLAAMAEGNREQARAAINRILLGVYHAGLRDLDVLKTLLMEMIVLMNRSAVDRGADPRALLALAGSFLRELSRIGDEESLSRWLTTWLEAFIGTPFRRPAGDPLPSLAPVLEYMRQNLREPISRAEAAAVVNLSQGHFSRLFHRRCGATFTETLARFRVERACELLEDPARRLREIATECGFGDQSYFCRVFRRARGVSPRQYRRRLGHAAVTPAGGLSPSARGG